MIYSLPTIKAMGGGRLFLRDEPGIQTMHGMTQARYDSITRLLQRQSYITEVDFGFPPGECVNLNAFRRVPRDLYCEWLPNHYLDMNGVDRAAAREKWLEAPTCHDTGWVVFSRSARYHNDQFPWAEIARQYADVSMFIGTDAEHAAFTAEFGSTRHVHTPDLLGVANWIANCSLFIGNQSCPLAIAEGLKKKIICEVAPQCPNCNSPRPDFYTSYLEYRNDEGLDGRTGQIEQQAGACAAG